MSQNFDFSVIIPVYNAEMYLEETLESLIGQTIGFRDHIQVILVNDGSADGSEDICLRYQKRYPDNIVYVKQENSGVSAARNHGLEYASGKYVNFLDSDDKWTPESFEEAWRYFEKHQDEIDVLAARVQFFEARESFHTLDYKFDEGTRIIDIADPENHCMIQSTAATTFIKRSGIGETRFDSKLKYGEDSTFINKVILKKQKYGLIAEALYLYRKRAAEGSAVNQQRNDKAYYTDSLVRYHMELENYSRQLYGEVLPYIQGVVVYDAGWRIQNPAYREVLNEEEIRVYHERLKQEFACIEDYVVIKNKTHKSIFRKAAMLELINGGNFMEDLTFDPEKQKLCYHDIAVANFKSKTRLYNSIDNIDIRDGRLHIEGRVVHWTLHATKLPVRFVTVFNGIEQEPEVVQYNHRRVKVEDGEEYYFDRFVFDEPIGDALKNNKKVFFQLFMYYGNDAAVMNLGCSKHVPSNDKLAVAYRFFGNYHVRIYRNKIEIIEVQNIKTRKLKNELHFYKGALAKKRFDLIRMRTRYHLMNLRKNPKKERWLISDRMDNAGDNGEVFFEYVMKQKPEDVEAIFVIGKNAQCVPRLKKLGKVIYFESSSYPYYFLTADKIISSGAAEFTINAFGPYRQYMSGFYQFKYYYLQHGVACADLSAWLNKVNKNIYRIFTSSPKEQEAFQTGDYFYDPEQILLTGMPRFDALRNGNNRQILIMPTWRRSIRESYDSATNSVYYEGFKETEYFKFYNALINDERLLRVMREKGYKGLFCLHPIHKEQAVDYRANDVFSVNQGYVDYNQCFEDSSLMVTDYSSVLFDFAYLRKPVIYAQFDKEEFFEGQIYDEGYFSYEEDGFGPVCYDYESTVEALISAVQNDCRNTDQYLKRVNRFFAFSDQNNCERIYREIRKS